jgi:hypothetical protein
MSEFSESYYWLGGEGAEALVRRVGRPAAVAPPGPRWTQIVFEREVRAADVVPHADGLLVHYVYAEDHACVVVAYEGGLPVATIDWGFEGENAGYEDDGRPVRRRGVDADALVARGLLTPDALARLRAAVEGHRRPDPENRYLVAEELGLTHYAWVDGESVVLADREALPPGARLFGVTPGEPGRPASVRGAGNAWCDLPGQPAWMYRPLPAASPAPALAPLVERHVRYWAEVGDPDLSTYRAYAGALPPEFAYLADRVLQCQLLARDHGEAWVERLNETLRALVALVGEAVGPPGGAPPGAAGGGAGEGEGGPAGG